MNILNRYSISYRLALAGAIALFGLLLISFEAMFLINKTLMQEKSTQTQNMVESVHSIIDGYYQQYKNGDITEEQAQQLAKQNVNVLRYAQGNYVWINDMGPTMIMHPIKPALIGKDLSQVKDPNGKYLFVEFVNAVKQSGAGTVDYFWSKPGSDEPVAKTSYVKSFQPWGWVIGTGVYLDDVDEMMQSVILRLLIDESVIFVLLIFSIFFIAKSIVGPIKNTADALEDLAKGEGDLTSRLPIQGKDEIARLSLAFNDFVEKIHTLVGSVKVSAEEVVRASNELVSKSHTGVAGAENQSAETAQIATASNEMVSTINEIASSASTAAELAQGANLETQAGKEIVNTSAKSVEQLSTEIQMASTVVTELDGECDSIDSVLSVIKAIAEQTNLLALNAAIEAARAGEQGRGFAVVADEVRTLAGRTQSATLEINAIIDQLQSKAKSAVQAIENSSTKAEDAVTQALKAIDSLDSIFETITSISDANSHIATAAEQQSAVTREIDERVVVVSDLAEQSNTLASDINTESELINRLGTQVNEQMSAFKM